MCRGPGIKTGKPATHVLMDVYRAMAIERTGVVEVLGHITKDPPGTSIQGALDVALPGARRSVETIARSSGVEMRWRHRNGRYLRRTLIVVSLFYSKGPSSCKSNFTKLQYSDQYELMYELNFVLQVVDDTESPLRRRDTVEVGTM